MYGWLAVMAVWVARWLGYFVDGLQNGWVAVFWLGGCVDGWLDGMVAGRLCGCVDGLLKWQCFG